MGRPETMRRSRALFKQRKEVSTSKHMSAKMGRSPANMGLSVSSMVRVAILEMRMVMTSSEGCSSPIWRLPIRRMPNTTTRYRIIVRKNVTSTKNHLAWRVLFTDLGGIFPHIFRRPRRIMKRNFPGRENDIFGEENRIARQPAHGASWPACGFLLPGKTRYLPGSGAEWREK